MNENKIITHSFKIPEGTQVAKGKGLARVTHLIIDEAQELPSEEEYIKVIDTFRTKGVERKIFIVFNPTSKLHWLHTRFYINGQPNPKWFNDHCFIHTTYKDNIDNIDPGKVEEWERMSKQDPEYFKHHILGQWREAYEGVIFSNWKAEWPQWEAERQWGLDWGYSTDPLALIEVQIRGKELKARELIYQPGLTNEEVYNNIIELGIPTSAQIICDSSEPKSIDDLKKLGLKRVQAAKKGPGSVISGIKQLSEYQIWVHPDSKGLQAELNSYRWKPGTDLPLDKDNHLIDALRYAIGKPGSKYIIS